MIPLLVAAAIGAVLALFWLDRRARAVREITRAALAMAGGELGARARVGDGDDDLARLGHAVNRLAEGAARSLDELRGERDLLAGVLDGMGEGVLMVGPDDRIVLANRALRGMALTGEDAVGKLVLEAIRSAALQQALDAAEGSAEPVASEIELGRLLPRKLLVRVTRLPGRAGAGARGLLAVFHDVTDLRRLETIRTDFVANVSHELRTPVTAISTATETLLGGALADPAEAAEFVDVIDRHAKRLRELVDDLLDLSRLESKNSRLTLVDVEVGPVLAHVVKLLEEPARRRRVEVRLGPQATALVRADRRALEQVLMNLLDNAIKYAGEGAHVTLGASAGELAELTVADDGAGIPKVHLSRIFERFYRVDAGRSREVGGTGLGLAIVKHLVELMGGSIEVESAPGKGSCFTIRLLRAAPP